MKKKLFIISAIVLLIASVLTACHKDPKETSGTENTANTTLATTETDSSSDGSEEVTSGETLIEPDATADSTEETLPTETEEESTETQDTETETEILESETVSSESSEETTEERTTTADQTTKAPETTQTPTQPATTKAAETTKAPEPTTKAPEPTTKAPEPTTKAPEPTTVAPTTAAPTTAAPTEAPKPTWTVTITAPKHQESVQRGYGSIAGAVYGLYKNGSKIGTYTTGSNGGFTAGPFEVGSGYELRLEQASKGYMINGDYFDERHVAGRVGIYKGGAITYSLGTEAKNYSFMNESCSIQKVPGDVNALCKELLDYAVSVGLENLGEKTGCFGADESYMYGGNCKESVQGRLRNYANRPDDIEGVWIEIVEHGYLQESVTVGLIYEYYDIRVYYG